jgi:hypothetical protein
MSDEGFSMQEEQYMWTGPTVVTGSIPAGLVRTVHSLQQSLEENANNLILMHHEVSGCWVLIAEDLRNWLEIRQLSRVK